MRQDDAEEQQLQGLLDKLEHVSQEQQLRERELQQSEEEDPNMI